MKNLSFKSKIIISALAFIAVSVLVWIAVLAFNGNIYSGISVCGVDIGGKSIAKASECLSGQDFFDTLPDFVCEDKKFSITPEEMDLKCDIEKTVELAHAYGRDENIFRRIGNIFSVMFNPVDLQIAVSYDEEKVDKIFEKELDDLRTPSVEPEIRVDGDKIYIKNGSQGLDVNRQKFKSDLSDVASGKKDDIVLVIETVNPTIISAQALYDEYAKTAENACYTIENMRIVYKESQQGLDFDVKRAEQTIAENSKNSKEYFIPVTLIEPEITVEQLDKSMFGDRLGTYTTKYNPGEVGRTQNVSVAARRINNIVLNTGDVFSYNSIVGERTPERGFSNAKVYAGGEVVDGLGGGICQVSSTLYNAVLYADLEIVARTSHSLPVAYVPLGRDATVAYGSIDFKFKNAYETPVKIISSVGGGILTVSVYGKKTSDKTVEISTERVSTSPFEVVEEIDETLAEGQTKVKQTGSDGAVVNTYKKVIENGKVISSKFIHKSVYNPINKIMLVSPPKEELQQPENIENGENVENIGDIPDDENETGIPMAEPEDEPTEPVTSEKSETELETTDTESETEPVENDTPSDDADKHQQTDSAEDGAELR